jgi:hypothetical protein
VIQLSGPLHFEYLRCFVPNSLLPAKQIIYSFKIFFLLPFHSNHIHCVLKCQQMTLTPRWCYLLKPLVVIDLLFGSHHVCRDCEIIHHEYKMQPRCLGSVYLYLCKFLLFLTSVTKHCQNDSWSLIAYYNSLV